MRCPECQFENREGSKFCKKCGAKSEFTCPKCDSLFTSTSKFCDECGQDLSKPINIPSAHYSEPHSYTPKHLAEKIFTTRSSIEGERKLVTVLFADVANFTSIAENIDPEKVHQIMDKCFKILMDEIHKCEGTINQFTGDGIMALFGAPLAHEDHTQRACLAAISIQKALNGYSQDLKTKHGIDFKMRIGMNSGPVVVGSIGDNLRMDYTAIGDTTNLAARMESMAKPGSILISENTYKVISPYFKCSFLGKIAVRGKEKPVKAYQLEDSREVYKPRLGVEREIYSEMVGREKELALLEHEVMKVINGEGSVVNIIGEAGIGKSRLVAEFLQRDVMKEAVHLEGRAISIGRNLSFHPVIDLLKQWAGIKLEDNEAACFEKLKSAVEQVCREEADEVLPFVATLMRIKLSGKYLDRISGIEGDALQKLILKNMRTLLIRATEQTPLVLIIEDLHWTDSSTIELLESMFRLVKTQSIVIINVFRPGYSETGVRIVKAIKERCPDYYTEIVLQPLDRHQSKALINNIVKIKGLHHRIRHEIIERAGGNPFFIEEVVRSFIDHGAVIPKDGGFEVTDKIDTMIIPQTINDVIMARIDGLEEQTRELLKIASVIGRSFFYRIILEVAKMIEDIDRRLGYLKEVQFILDRRRLEELEYIFKHALAQQTAYESILQQKRKKLHLKVANSIEEVFQSKLGEFYGMLAYHYSNADDLDKAENYMIKAGEEALKSSASSEALYYYQNAMELYIQKFGQAADRNKISELEENIGFAFFNRGYYEEAIQRLTQALFISGIKEPKNRIYVTLKLAFNLFALMKNLYLPSIRKKKTPSRFDNRVIRIVLQRGKALAIVDAKRVFIESILLVGRIFKADISKSQLYFDTICGMSALFSWTGISFWTAKRLLEYATKSIKNKETTISLHFYKYMETIYDSLVGNWHKKLDKNAIDHALKIGDLNVVALHLLYFNIMRGAIGDFETCERIIDRLSDIVESFEHDYALYSLLVMKTRYLLQKRQLLNTIETANEAIELADKMGIEIIKLSVLGPKLKAQVMLDELDAANKTIEISEKVLRDQYHVPPLYLSQFYVGRFLYDIAILEKSIVLNKKQDNSKLMRSTLISGRKALSNSKKVAERRTEVYRLNGKYFWIINKNKRALKWWSKAISEGKRLGARPELARTYMEVGKGLSESESQNKKLNGIGANEYMKKARSMFKEMGLQWDLDELEKLSTTLS